MGYMTEYDLKVMDKKGKTISESVSDELDEPIREMSNLDWYDRGEWGGSEHWYSYEKDMVAFSKEYPEYVFILRGRGEEIDDEWASLFMNGEESFWDIPSMVEDWAKTVVRSNILLYGDDDERT